MHAKSDRSFFSTTYDLEPERGRHGTDAALSSSMKSTAGSLTILLATLALTACAGQSDAEAVDNLPVQSSLVDAEKLAVNDDRETLMNVIDGCREGGQAAGRYRTPSEQAMSAVERALKGFAEQNVVDVPEGFVAYDVGSLVVLCEAENHGGGAFVLRSDAQSPAVIEVPHSFYDLKSLDAGLALFSRLGARALLVNTTHRYRGADCQRQNEGSHSDSCESDMTHSESTLFQAAHRGLIEGNADAMAIQVHGFAPRAQDPDIIVSNADTDACYTQVADALNERLPNHITFEYPEDIHELGGTLGVQAKHMQAKGRRMMHLELSKRLRTELSSDTALASDFAAAVAVGLTQFSCGG